jgi:hypothetical protein
MSKRGSRSAVFIGEIKKYVRKFTIPKAKSNFDTPKNFKPKIKFYTKDIIYTKNHEELITYVKRLEEEYELLQIKKPDRVKVFIRIDYKKIETVRKAVLEIHRKIRQIEIYDYLQKH